MSDWVFAARDRGRQRAGAAPGETVYVCRSCGATHRDDTAMTCGKADCARDLARYELTLRGEGRFLGWAHNPAVAGSTPAPATSHNAKGRR